MEIVSALSFLHFQRVLEDLDPWIAASVVDDNISTLGIAVQAKEGMIFNRVYRSSGQVSSPVTGEAPLFAIGSSSKTVTVAAILKMVEQGRLRLSDRFLEFFPEITVPKSSPLQQITLLNLMRHQSSLASIERGWFQKKDMTAEEVLRKFSCANINVAGKRVKQWDYSALGMVLLGLIIERVSGMRYDNYVISNLLRPAALIDMFPAISGMRQSDRSRILRGQNVDDKNRVFQIKLVDRKAINASGGYVASVRDTARFYHYLLTGKILSAAHTRMLHQACVTFGHKNDGLSYSPGLQHKRIGKGKESFVGIGHIGNFRGFCAFTRFYPSLGMTISITTNSVVLPVDREHIYPGDVFPGGLAIPLVNKMRALAAEATENGGFVNQTSLSMPLPPLRRPRIPWGFNPETCPR